MSENFNYEESIKRLEEIVNLLNDSTLGLDKSIQLYEEGIKLSRQCSEKLNEAKQKITELEK